MSEQKTKGSMAEALLKNTPVQALKKKEEAPVAPVSPSTNMMIKDSEDDFDFSRKNIKNLITTSGIAIESMLALAQDAEHPRAFEVLATMLKSTADMNSQLFDLNKERKKYHEASNKKDEPQNISTTNNTIFVGTTNDLQQLIIDRVKLKQVETIDV